MIVGIDTGGTFTDFVLITKGGVLIHKLPSTPDNPARAVIEGWRALIKGRGPVEVTYGTTVATNALLERKGARVALVTTQGFEDLIEIGRQTRTELYALEPRKIEPLVPRSLRIGVAERVLADGRVLSPLSEADLTKAKKMIQRNGVRSVAVCFLHAYRNPSHERKAEKRLRSLGLPLSVSHRILPEYREYERLSTTMVNAYVAPLIANHVADLERDLKREAGKLRGGLRVMQSNGGAITPRGAREQAVRTLLSGPAGGVVGAYEVARQVGIPRMISLDMGGTSTDVCLADREIPLTQEKSIAGIPVRVPMVEIHTVGAGGGSIAHLDLGGALKVGPESAGAHPGPVCYGRGEEITVTDANLFLGRLDPDRFLGGRMRLDLKRTIHGMKKLAGEIGMDPIATAWGILQVINSNMESAIRAVSVERGFDPKEFTLVAFGGAGGLHAADLVEALRMSHILIPERPGLLSAWGMARTPLAKDLSLSVLEKDPEFFSLRRRLSSLVERGLKEMQRERLRKEGAKIYLSVDLRYVGQAYEITVPWAKDFIRRFHQLHESRFGHSDSSQEVEVVTLRVRIESKRERTRERPQPLKGGRGRQALLGHKEVYFSKRFVRCPTYQRERLIPGDRMEGPAVIYEFSSTIVVPPAWRAEVDGYRNLRLLRG